jgi:hypothetical protein
MTEVNQINQLFLVVHANLHQPFDISFFAILFYFQLILFTRKQVFQLLAVNLQHRASNEMLIFRLIDVLKYLSPILNYNFTTNAV